jgi:hypothetical protein
LGMVIPGVKRVRLRFWECGATTGAKARVDLGVLRGAEAPLFHVTAYVRW